MTDGLPALPAPFTWRGEAIAVDLPDGHVRFTTRRTHGSAPGLAGPAGDPPDAGVDVVAALAGVAAGNVVQGRQVHGAGVRLFSGDERVVQDAGECDGVVTTLRGVACAVRTADCLPVALVSPHAAGVVHAGWRGLVAGVVEAGVATVRGAGAGPVTAAIGPGAGPCCYEVGEEVHRALAPHGPQARVGEHADLKAVARAILEREGVAAVHDTGLCTQCAPRGLLWSFRNEGAAAGRQAGVAWRS